MHVRTLTTGSGTVAILESDARTMQLPVNRGAKLSRELHDAADEMRRDIDRRMARLAFIRAAADQCEQEGR